MSKKEKIIRQIAFLLWLAACWWGLTNIVFATVPSTENIRDTYTLGAATTEFDVTIPANSNDELLVYKKLITTGVETLLTITTDYTIVADAGGYLDGSTVTTNAALGVLYQVVIVRSVKTSQETAQGAITPTTVVASLDKLTRIVQDLVDRVDRSWRLPDSDAESFDVEMPTLAARLSSYPYFDASGILTYVSSIVTNGALASNTGLELMQAATPAAARGTLELDTTDAVEFAAITGTTGAFSGSITLGANADLIGSASSDITINTDKFTVAGASGNTVIAGTLSTGVATLAASSVLATSPATADDSTKIATTAYVKLNTSFGDFTSLDIADDAMEINEDYTAAQDGFVSVIFGTVGTASHMSGQIGGSTRVQDKAETNSAGGFTLVVASGDIFRINTAVAPESYSIYWRGAQATIKPTKVP